MKRYIETGWGTHKLFPHTYVAFAECKDDRTEMVLFHPSEEMLKAVCISESEMPTSELYRSLVSEHLSRCEQCGKHDGVWYPEQSARA